MTKLHGIYCCIDPKTRAVYYVGSTGIDLTKVESNHRNYFKFRNGYESSFRKALRYEGSEWTFEWLQEPRDIPRNQCEIEEGACIRMLRPKYNVDLYPYERSVREGRAKQI